MFQMSCFQQGQCYYCYHNYLFCYYYYYFFQSDENEDDQLDSKANKLNLEQRRKKRKYLFKLTLVNSYGSNDVQALEDNSKPLKLTGWQAFAYFFFSVVVCLSLPLGLMSILDKSSLFLPLLRTSLLIIQFGKHIGIYEITKIVRALWLAERLGCMRVCKLGCVT